MKRILALLLVLMMTLTFACPALSEQAKVMTSFYPVHIFALNVFDGIDDVSVECMTPPQTGCLHDYQLIVNDMLKLADSELFIVCGAGMETYLDDVKMQLPDLRIADCSEGIDLICEDDPEGHTHDGHDHAYNAHIWMAPRNAVSIVETIANAGIEAFPENAERIRSNADNYILRLYALDAELSERLSGVSGKKIVTFHDAFPYFAQAYGLEIVGDIGEGHEESLSPHQIVDMIQLVQKAGLPPLFEDEQHGSQAAKTIAHETGAALYTLSSIVSGDITLTAYEDAMRRNADVILYAFDTTAQ